MRVVAFTDDWRADAARRDFTINAMSMTRDGAVFDYFGGIADLRAGRLRFVGDPATRIAEDYLRILRYLPVLRPLRQRSRRSGGAGGDPRRRAGACGAVGRAGVERAVRASWPPPDPRAAIALMADLGVLHAGAAGRAPIPSAWRAWSQAGAPADPLLRLAALLTGDAAALADTAAALGGASGIGWSRCAPAPVPQPRRWMTRRCAVCWRTRIRQS